MSKPKEELREQMRAALVGLAGSVASNIDSWWRAKLRGANANPNRTHIHEKDYKRATEQIESLITTHTNAILQEVLDELPEYESKTSRLYFSANYNPLKAHKNGFRLGIREITEILTNKKERDDG